MGRYTVFTVMAATLLAAGPSAAQTAELTERVEAINAAVPAPEAEEASAALLAALQHEATRAEECVPTGVEVETITPVTADRNLTQVIARGQFQNVWQAYIQPTGCPEGKSQRFMVVRQPDGQVQATLLNKGESLTSPTILLDAYEAAAPFAIAEVNKVDPECRNPGAITTMPHIQVTARSEDLGPDFYGLRFSGSWQELWTIKVCGHIVEVPQSFEADGEGGVTIQPQAEGVRLLP